MRTHPKRIGRFPLSFDYDIGALADCKSNDVRLIRLNGNIVICNDLHCVTVDRESLQSFGSRIDQAQSVGFA